MFEPLLSNSTCPVHDSCCLFAVLCAAGATPHGSLLRCIVVAMWLRDLAA